ncbi:hypothetical protein BV372_35210 [Nostoc sp. T09]|nr:hypothetical protein BV372_35210 [Nostoc sp. T09]
MSHLKLSYKTKASDNALEAFNATSSIFSQLARFDAAYKILLEKEIFILVSFLVIVTDKKIAFMMLFFQLIQR